MVALILQERNRALDGYGAPEPDAKKRLQEQSPEQKRDKQIVLVPLPLDYSLDWPVGFGRGTWPGDVRRAC